GLWAQWRLEEAGGGQRAPGEFVLLSCRGSGFNFGFLTVYWYRQAPGGRPEWVAVISHDSSVTQNGPAMKGRALVSRDNSQSKSSLYLWALHVRDSARYFCAVHTRT
ncbi:HVC33 protein, partial [Onychorhynchus coronatus]|nr:HVC33 protein [Onychorhynchus coronatus]